MTGDSKPGDALADKIRESIEKNRKESDVSLTRLEVRADMQSSGEEELSDVIDRETLERQRKKSKESEVPKASPTVIVLTVVRKLTPLGATLIGLAAIAAYVAIALLKK